MKHIIFFLVFVFAGVAASAQGVPPTMNYQGYLTDLAGVPYNGTLPVSFSLYTTETGGTPLWTEVHSTVAVSKGLFSVVLGSIVPLNLPFDQQYYLGITVSGDPELAPRVRLTSSAYSMRTRMADNIVDGVVTTAKIANGAVTAEKIVDNAVTGPKIANGAVGTLQIVDGAVVASKIADNVITADHVIPPIVSSINNVTNDGGNINLIAGANVTITPDDAANTITISATSGGGGLTLPYNNSIANSATAFRIENTGAGEAGEFRITNSSSSVPALTVANNSSQISGHAFCAQSYTGNAIQALNQSASMAALSAGNLGDGPSASFFKRSSSTGDILNLSNAGGSGKGINLEYQGTTQGILTNVTSGASGIGIEVDMNGTGNAGYFHIDQPTSSNSSLKTVSNSTNTNSDALEAVATNGNAVDARNSSSTSPTLNAVNSSPAVGSRAAYFESAATTGTIQAVNNNASANGMIFEGYAGTSQVFRMYNSGNFYSYGGLFSTYAVLREELGSTDTPLSGGYYKDNAIYAWANIASSGTIAGGGSAAFGCTVSRTSTGTYNISYKRTMSGSAFAPMAIAVEGSAPQFAVISSVSNSGCTVKIWKYNTVSNTFALEDSQFFFILCGRP